MQPGNLPEQALGGPGSCPLSLLYRTHELWLDSLVSQSAKTVSPVLLGSWQGKQFQGVDGHMVQGHRDVSRGQGWVRKNLP